MHFIPAKVHRLEGDWLAIGPGNFHDLPRAAEGIGEEERRCRVLPRSARLKQ